MKQARGVGVSAGGVVMPAAVQRGPEVVTMYNGIRIGHNIYSVTPFVVEG